MVRVARGGLHDDIVAISTAIDVGIAPGGVGCISDEDIIALAADENVVPDIAVDIILAVPPIDVVVPCASSEVIHTATAKDQVVTVASADDVISPALMITIQNFTSVPPVDNFSSSSPQTGRIGDLLPTHFAIGKFDCVDAKFEGAISSEKVRNAPKEIWDGDYFAAVDTDQQRFTVI